jgi:ADP-ribosylglycohydrolase
VAALLLSGGDFHKGITLAVMGGWDTDCNGATVGSIVGAISGAKAAPRHWTGRLNDTLKSLIIDYHPIAISECARKSVEIARKVENFHS